MPFRVFVDSAVLDDVIAWVNLGVGEGVTTNPLLLAESGAKGHWQGVVARLIEKVAPLPVSVQVTTPDKQVMLEEALHWHASFENAVVKIPVLLPDGEPTFDTIAHLAREGVSVNATACFSVAQAALSAKAGADYVSVLWGRISDEGGDPARVLGTLRDIFRRDAFDTAILAASLRTSGDVTSAIVAGADIVAVPPPVLSRWIDHRFARQTSTQFFAAIS